MTRDHIASHDGAALMTIAPNGDAQRAAPLFVAAYTAFDRAGRTLNVDASELAESVDLAAMLDALTYALGYVESDIENDRESAQALTLRDKIRAQLSKIPKPANT